jgi:hypothetical protein
MRERRVVEFWQYLLLCLFWLSFGIGIGIKESK